MVVVDCTSMFQLKQLTAHAVTVELSTEEIITLSRRNKASNGFRLANFIRLSDFDKD